MTNQLALNFSMGAVPTKERDREEKLALQAQVGSFEVNTYHQMQRNPHLGARPRQLSQLLLKQEVVIHQQPQSNNYQAQQQLMNNMRPPTATPNKLIASLASSVNRSNPSQQQQISAMNR